MSTASRRPRHWTAHHADAGKGDSLGTITIRTRYDPPWAEIRVEDTGAGIAPDLDFGLRRLLRHLPKAALQLGRIGQTRVKPVGGAARIH